MYTVDLYLRVRLACHVDGLSQREAASRFGIARETVRKMLRHSEPPGYRRRQPPKRPKLAPFTDIIDRILEEDRTVHRKQHHTAKRIFERLRDEHGFTGKETIVKDYVRERRLRRREMFVPLSHPPGHAQADFGEADAIIAGVKYRAHFFVMTLPHSDACFVAAYPAATTEAWLDGHNRAFVFFGSVPQSILYDNDKCLVSRILSDGTRQRTRAFSGLQSHYLFEDRYGRPGKGNDKGNVEGVVGYARRNFMTPLPRFASWDAFNGHLEEQCRNRQGNVLRGHRESIGERFVRDREALKRPLPAPFDACDKQGTRVNSLSLVRYRTNDYSVPVAYGHQEVWIRGYVHEVVIGCGAGIIARHPRSYDREDMVFDPIHYLPLLEHKIGALDQAAPLAGWELPDAFPTLRRLLEARMGKAGKREYVQVLRLVETFDLEVLHGAVKDALRLGAIGYDAVKHLVLCRIERRPPKLDLDIYPYLPRANVATTAAASYMTDIPHIPSKFVEIVPLSHRQGTVSPLQPSDGMILVIGPRLEGHSVIFLAIQTHLSCRFLLAVDSLGLHRSGSSSQIINQAQDFPEQVPRHRHLSQLERNVAAMSDNLGPDLHQLVAQRRHRPVLHLLRQSQCPHEVAQIVGQGEKLEPNGIVAELAT